MVQRNLGQNMIYWIGEVVDVNDPHQSGRVKIRVYGHHDDRTNIPDSALPWAQVTQSPTSAAIGRIGSAPVGLVVGSRVVGFWADSSDLQYPLVIGSMGKAGDPINGEMLNGSPAIDTSLGSIPQSSSGNPNNPYSTLNQDRVSISDIDTGSANVTSVSSNTGGVLTTLVESSMANPTLPTVASYNKNSNMNVLDIVNAIDPVGSLSSLPCLNNNLISISSILKFLGNTVQGVVSGIVNTAVQAIKNAILKLAQKVGLFKLLGTLNSAVSKVKEIQKLMNTLNIRVCGMNPINQGIFDTANYAMASVIGGLNSTVGAITGGINNIINLGTGAVTAAGSAVSGATNSAINSLINSVPKVPAIAVTTATSPRPLTTSIVQTPPDNYIQQYYTIDRDPYPGYIEWKDPTSTGSSVYTLRNGEPNYANAQEHTTFAAQNHFTSTIGNTLLNGQPLSFDTLSKAVSGSLNFTQTFGLSKVLGAGFGAGKAAGVLAALIPTVISGFNTIFQPSNGQAKYTGGATTQSVNNFMQSQGILARQSALMRAGLNRT
jgi:hypothetical protein